MSDSAAARASGIPRATVRDWRHSGVAHEVPTAKARSTSGRSSSPAGRRRSSMNAPTNSSVGSCTPMVGAESTAWSLERRPTTTCATSSSCDRRANRPREALLQAMAESTRRAAPSPLVAVVVQIAQKRQHPTAPPGKAGNGEEPCRELGQHRTSMPPEPPETSPPSRETYAICSSFRPTADEQGQKCSAIRPRPSLNRPRLSRAPRRPHPTAPACRHPPRGRSHQRRLRDGSPSRRRRGPAGTW
jgi:hypothetical protein